MSQPFAAGLAFHLAMTAPVADDAGRDPQAEHERDLAHAAGILAALDDEAKGAVAYDHASHGCPFEDSRIACPVGCDAPDNIAMQSEAFFGGVTQADGAA